MIAPDIYFLSLTNNCYYWTILRKLFVPQREKNSGKPWKDVLTSCKRSSFDKIYKDGFLVPNFKKIHDVFVSS